MERLVVTRGSPEIVGGVDGDARLAGGRQIRCHRRTDHVHLLREDRVDVGLDRVEPWRNEHARRTGALLVHVVDNLRMPDVVKLRDGGARFRLREDVPVAIVIVSHIFVIELRRAGAFACVPSVLRYQRVTISTPSGLSEGTSSRIVLCRMASKCGLSSVISR